MRIPEPQASPALRVEASAPSSWRKAASRLRAWPRSRRLRFTRGGLLFTVGAFAIGVAAIYSGNNLLYLLLGSMLGLIAISGWLSERTLRGLRVRRRATSGASVDDALTVSYSVQNLKAHLPSFAVRLREEGLPTPAFLGSIPPGETLEARAAHSFARRGVYPLRRLTLDTEFPFGLFRKSRVVDLPGELLVWPRASQAVVVSPPPASGRRATGSAAAPSPGARGEFAGLRDYRPGDDGRDLHWRSTARRGALVTREYESEASEVYWIRLDLRRPPDDAAERDLEEAASAAVQFFREGSRFGFSSGVVRIDPARGRAHLERVLDEMARLDFDPAAPAPVVPGFGNGSVRVRPA